MNKHPLQHHFRQTFLAGIFAVVPVAVTVFIVYLINQKTSDIEEWVTGKRVPFVGILIALMLIYLAGLVATTLLGRFFLRIIDRILASVPVLRTLYTAWKQVALTPGGTEGVFSKVVVIPDETGATYLLGFSNGRPIDGDADTYCVFVPAAPNPINGRLYFVHREKCQFVDVTPEEAFKVILSTGNYVPPGVGEATRRMNLTQAIRPTAQTTDSPALR
jgi:uncharacterized membrane protein